MIEQLPLLAGVEREDRPYKDVRRVSKQIIRELRDSGYVKRSGKRVLLALEFYRLKYEDWPTPAELTRFMFRKGWIPRDDPRLTAPRLTELIHGAKVRRDDGSRVVLGGGVCEQMKARECAITGQSAHPVGIREIGSVQQWVA